MIGGNAKQMEARQGSGDQNGSHAHTPNIDGPLGKEKHKHGKAASVDEEIKPAEPINGLHVGGNLPPLVGSAHKKTKSSDVTGPLKKDLTSLIDDQEDSIKKGKFSPDSPNTLAKQEVEGPMLANDTLNDSRHKHHFREQSQGDSARRSMSRS